MKFVPMDEIRGPNRIFLSCSSAEFENFRSSFPGLRTQLACDLRRANFDVKVQEELAQSGLDILQKLDAYIRTCGSVLHLVGGNPGAVANAAAVRSYLEGEPRFLHGLADLSKAIGDFYALTYTQWEAFIALHHRVDLFVYTTQVGESAQATHLANLRIARRHPGRFSTSEELYRLLLGDLRTVIPALPTQAELTQLQVAVDNQNQRFLASTNVELINGSQVKRKETDAVIDHLATENSRGTLLIAEAGYGKSCVLAQIISKFHADGVSFIAFKLDIISECSTANQLGKELELTESPVTVLGKLAAGRPCVLIVDQLDAISTVSGRKTNTWNAFDELLREANNFPNMKLVIACRKFDLEQDHRLRQLDNDASGFRKVEVNKFSEPELRDALNRAGLLEFQPTPQQTVILSVPLHLTLFLQGDPEKPFSRVGELFESYWNRKQQSLREALGRPGHWTEVVDRLAQYMSNTQSLSAPKDIVDHWQTDARQMASLHVLIEHRKSFQFFHEAFFDYAFARGFCRAGQTLLSFLSLPGEEQHLFRRAQVRQILGYRRENRPDEYYLDLCQLLTSEEVRFHIRRMVASELHRIPDPDEREWQVIEPLLWEHDLSRYIRGSLRDHAGWFDLLNRIGIWKQWLATTDETLLTWTLWFLEAPSLHRERSADIAILLEPFAKPNGGWDEHLKRIFQWGVAHHSERMANILLAMIERGAYDNDPHHESGGGFWSNQYAAEKDNPRFIIDLLACWLRHAIKTYNDGDSWNFLDKASLNHSHSGAMLIGKAAVADPQYFLNRILPIVIEAVCATEVQKDDRLLNRTWPQITNFADPSDINDAVLVHTRRALQWYAANQTVRFREVSEAIKSLRHETITFLLLSAYSENPIDFANECITYMLDHQPRFYIGYGCWTGGGTGESAVSRTAIQAATVYCDDSVLRRLEDAVIEYCDAYERRTPGRRGFAEYLLLQAIEPSRRSNRVSVRISELKCDFPMVKAEIPPVDESTGMSWVGPPIPPDRAELMTDDQWLSAMRKYDRDTERSSGGGYIELSRLLSDLTRTNRIRFANLALSMPSDLDPDYFEAILNGISGHGSNLAAELKDADNALLAEVPTELIEAVIVRLHQLPERPCGKAILHSIHKLPERFWTNTTLEVVRWYAIEDRDPIEDCSDGDEANSFYQEPLHHGINSVRGQAAWAIAALLFHDSAKYVPLLLPTVRRLITDPVIAVRCCTIEALMAILNLDRDLAISLFLECTELSPRLWTTSPFDSFLQYCLWSHYNQVRPLLQRLLESGEEKAVEIAVSKLVVSNIGGVAPDTDALPFHTSADKIRETACHVYARNIAHSSRREVADKAAQRLKLFFNDESEDVRKHAANAFWSISGERLLELESMILDFIESQSFETDPEDLLRSLEQSSARLPHVVCRAAERILEFVASDNGEHTQKMTWRTHSICSLVVRQYAQANERELRLQCLNLIDRMERLGFFGISDELNKIDR